MGCANLLATTKQFVMPNHPFKVVTFVLGKALLPVLRWAQDALSSLLFFSSFRMPESPVLHVLSLKSVATYKNWRGCGQHPFLSLAAVSVSGCSTMSAGSSNAIKVTKGHNKAISAISCHISVLKILKKSWKISEFGTVASHPSLFAPAGLSTSLQLHCRAPLADK